MNFHCQLHLLFVSFVLYYQTATWQIVKGHVKPLHASNLVQMDMHDVFFVVFLRYFGWYRQDAGHA